MAAIISLVSCHPYVKMEDDAREVAGFSEEASNWIAKYGG